jgi:hypothetical protein
MERCREGSFSSSTLSSNSSVTSRSSSASYASIKSYTSRISTSVKSGDFWIQFNRYSSLKRRSFGRILKDIFIAHQMKDEIPKHNSVPLLEFEAETTVSEYKDCSTCPPGLYCVIDDFLTEYDLRLLEEEERAEIVAKKRQAT